MTDDTATVPVKSCSTCPSFLGSTDLQAQVANFGTIYRAPTCAVKGKLLGGPTAPHSVNEKIQEAVARTCNAHGKAAPRSQQPANTLTVALPMPQIGAPSAPFQAVHDQPKSCRLCKFFVPAKTMQEEIGITTGLCAIKGNLVSEQSTSKVAKGCTVGESMSTGGNVTDLQAHYEEMLADCMILPELRPALQLGKKIGANLPEPEIPFVDPQDYPTDAPVTPEDQALGIKAWRKFYNDDGSKSVEMPVFDINHFSPDEQAKIPRTGDTNNPELYKDHQNLAFKCAVIWKLEETPALHGVAGTGKTEFFRYMAWLLGLPFERVSITASSELDDLAGKTHYTPEKGTFFEMGRIPRAWGKPCVQVIDEPNVGSPAVWQFIRPMTDNAKQLVLDMNEGQVVDRHKYSFLGMAMNPAWDYRNVGAEVISDADGSRLMHIFVEFPDEKIEREILRKRCDLDGFKISPDQLNKVMGIADDLRALAKDQSLPITWGIRQQIKVVRALAWFNFPEAYRLAAADYLEPEVQEIILDKVRLKTS